VVGDTTLAEIKPAAGKAFGGWQAGAAPQKNMATVAQPEKP
jgi:zinc protease